MEVKEKKFEVLVKSLSVNEETSNEDVIYVKGFANKYKGESDNIVIDRARESVPPSAYDLSSFMKNPVLLFEHNQSEIIGKVIDIQLTGNGLEISAEIHKALNPKVFYAVQNGILKAFSIGFKALDAYYDDQHDIWYWTKVDLLEVSVVSVPENQESIFSVVADSPCGNGVCLMSVGNKVQTKAIKNSVISDKPWSEVDKTALGQKLAEMGKESYIKEAYLVVPDIESRSTWKFPHHELDGNDLILNKNGVTAAWAALQGARNEPNITEEEKVQAAKHLLKHYRELLKQEMIEEIPEELQDMAKNTNADVTKAVSENDYTVENIVSEISKESGVSEDEVRKMLLFLNFSLYKEDGSKTKFASKYSFKKDSMYQDLYNWLKDTKDSYKNDHEKEAFSDRMRVCALSTISRASAWIYKTYVSKQEGNEAEKLLQARTFAESWFMRTMGITTENLLKFKDVVKKMDQFSSVVSDYANSQNYKENSKDKAMDNKVEKSENNNVPPQDNEGKENEVKEPTPTENVSFNKEDIIKFIENNAETEEGISFLFELYSHIETTINNSLPKFLS